MKILFLTYHGFEAASGISKKMLAQIKGLRQNSHEVYVCSYDYAKNGHMCRFVDNKVIKDYGKGVWAGIYQRMSYGCVADYCIANGIEFVYSRNYQNPLRKVFFHIVGNVWDPEMNGSSRASGFKTLKNREYASRGIPFIYSECDSDFDHHSTLFL